MHLAINKGYRSGNLEGTMHLATKRIKQLGLVVTGMCTAVVLLLFVHTNRSKTKTLPKDVGHRTAQHRLEGALSIIHGTKQKINTQSEDEFMVTQVLVQQKRQRQIREGCQAMANFTRNVPTFEKLPKQALTHLIVDDNYRLLYCSVPKVASTSWVRIFLVLKGVLEKENDVEQKFVHRGAMESLRLLSSYTDSEVRTILSTYTKIVFVRNPFTRLLSAFRNKLESKESPNGHNLWKGWVHRIKNQGRNGPPPVELGSEAQEGNLTFREFVRYVSNRSAMANKHWTSMVHRCRPCQINYTFVGKIETIKADSRALFKLAKIDKLVSFPDAGGSSPTNSSTSKIIASYFAELSSTDINRLHKRYQWDFRIFGYNLEQGHHGTSPSWTA
ncbi:carbohydrate sulfotransferase 11-like isoform X2 [Acanthaster planci]|uniref:Carbohydrate sulfotransferase n=1 Tax=Acanthaster planci TaxID=133434 RepID=A0A8B7XUZ3_ACAPL|nr:carbohydrate sulfotransferase 11-like isoform X2 [Acanthaster planci]